MGGPAVSRPTIKTPITMKTTLLSLAAALGLSLGTANLRAATPDSPVSIAELAANSRLERAVKHQINRHMNFPLEENGDRMYGAVEVSFAVNAEGRLVVLSATSDNDALRSYVVDRLGRVQVAANPSGMWRTSHVCFVFRPE
jgi:hypothetical protein